MDKLQREYDRFGPWVAEIKEEDDVPQQFDAFAEAILKADFSFKIPVFEERRNLKPGMVLYTTVVSVAGNRLTIRHLKEDASLDSREIDLGTLQYLQSTKAMLLGELNLASAEQSLLLAFNPVDPEPIEKLEALVRDHYCSKEEKIDLDAVIEPTLEQSFLYETLLATESRKENLKIIAYQPSITLHGDHVPMLKRLLAVSEEYILEDTLFLTNGHELIVMSRVKDMKEVRQSDYGYRYTYIPLGNIRTILLEPEENVQAILSLSIVTENTRVVFKVEEHFPINALRETITS